MNNFQELRDLAAKVLNEDGQAAVSEHLDHGEDRQVRIYLLGALDKQFVTGVLSDEELKAAYATLGLDTDLVSKIRSDNHLI